MLRPTLREVNITKFQAVLDQGKSWVVGTSVPLEEQENKALCRHTAPAQKGQLSSATDSPNVVPAPPQERGPRRRETALQRIPSAG